MVWVGQLPALYTSHIKLTTKLSSLTNHQTIFSKERWYILSNITPLCTQEHLVSTLSSDCHLPSQVYTHSFSPLLQLQLHSILQMHWSCTGMVRTQPTDMLNPCQLHWRRDSCCCNKRLGQPWTRWDHHTAAATWQWSCHWDAWHNAVGYVRRKTIPSKLNKSVWKPLFKKSDPSDPNNHSFIVLQLLLTKTVANMTNTLLINYLETCCKGKLFSSQGDLGSDSKDQQHCQSSLYSTSRAVNRLTQPMYVIFVDLEKAFAITRCCVIGDALTILGLTEIDIHSMDAVNAWWVNSIGTS